MKTDTKGVSPADQSCFLRVFAFAFIWLLVFSANVNARQLFYVLDRTGGPAYANMVKCYDLNGTFQYEILSEDPPGPDAYGALATDGNTLWLAGAGLGHIRSFSIRPGAPGGITIPLQTTDLPSHGGCTGLALGTNTADETDPNGNRINMGAYGGTDEASRSPAGWSLVSDMNNDGTENLLDLVIQLEGWMEQCDQCPGDLNRDGEVNLADFAISAQDWKTDTVWR